eukprot:scaffold518_cov388-Prasinococcus_capsulatus_cf.AAC.78
MLVRQRAASESASASSWADSRLFARRIELKGGRVHESARQHQQQQHRRRLPATVQVADGAGRGTAATHRAAHAATLPGAPPPATCARAEAAGRHQNRRVRSSSSSSSSSSMRRVGRIAEVHEQQRLTPAGLDGTVLLRMRTWPRGVHAGHMPSAAHARA